MVSTACATTNVNMHLKNFEVNQAHMVTTFCNQLRQLHCLNVVAACFIHQTMKIKVTVTVCMLHLHSFIARMIYGTQPIQNVP